LQKGDSATRIVRPLAGAARPRLNFRAHRAPQNGFVHLRDIYDMELNADFRPVTFANTNRLVVFGKEACADSISLYARKMWRAFTICANGIIPATKRRRGSAR
jgi:hypothetical protein